jgi:hypothetical protein
MVVKLRTVVGMAMIWLAAVAGVSATAWVAIDRAGRDITGGVVSSLPKVELGTPGGARTPGSSPTTNTAAPEPSATAEPSATREHSAAPVPSAPPGPSATPGSETPSSSTTPQDRTVSVTGGQVSVRCTGASILLRIAQPDNGWRVEVDNAGPDQVHVTFRSGDEEEGGGTQVTAVCAMGTPAFTVANTG